MQRAGRRILVVEDEFLIAMAVEAALRDEGAEVELASTVAAGREALGRHASGRAPLAAAVLDVRLGDELVFPLADEVARAGLPFVFHSAHAEADKLRRRYPSAAVVTKPASGGHLASVLGGCLTGAADAASPARNVLPAA